MHTSYISTFALRNAPRAEIVRLQRELVERTVEVATSRHADVNLALGPGAGRTVSTRMDLSLLESLQRSNTGAMARLAQSQDALADMRTTASEMLEALVALPTGDAAARTLVIQAQTSLARLADRLNASDGGSYLFGGINTDEAPFSRFDDGPAAAIAAAFNGRFLFSPGDPAAAGITPAQIVDFIENEFADLFADPDWGTTWSTASSTNIVSRIAPGERIETSANANETAFRTLARGLSMLAGIGFESLNSTTRDAVVEQAQLVIGAAVTEIAAVQGRLGFAENSIEKANTRLSHAADVLRMTITEKEGTDPAAAKVRVDLLTTQIEMSYALTNQLSRLSILNYA